MDYGHNMEPDLEKLVTLLRKLLKKHPQGTEHLSKILDSKAINLNLCFLTFMPMSMDEMEELNELAEDALHRSDEALKAEDEVNLEFKLTRGDLDFLKKNGIDF